MSELKEIASRAADDLTGAFSWADTSQGHNYWARAYQDLRKLAELEHDYTYAEYVEADIFDRDEEVGPILIDEHDRKSVLDLAKLVWQVQKQVPTTLERVRWLQVYDYLAALAGEEK